VISIERYPCLNKTERKIKPVDNPDKNFDCLLNLTFIRLHRTISSFCLRKQNILQRLQKGENVSFSCHSSTFILRLSYELESKVLSRDIYVLKGFKCPYLRQLSFLRKMLYCCSVRLLLQAARQTAVAPVTPSTIQMKTETARFMPSM
jgi:hypothetical protein